MNLQLLFQAQKQISERIVKEKGLEGQDLLAKDIRALLTELGELSNEERSFKYWSEDQEPRTELAYAICRKCGGSGTPIGIPDETGVDCWNCEGTGELVSNPLLEEYSDCLSFILKIGVDADVQPMEIPYIDMDDTTELINYLFEIVVEIRHDIKNQHLIQSGYVSLRLQYEELWGAFVKLGRLLGFTWQEVETAYFEKNKINHERQTNGY